MVVASSTASMKSGHSEKKKNSQYAALQFYRTALCNDYKNGHCPRADDCTFAHGEVNLCHRPRLTKTKMCPKKGCTRKDCSYAHSRKELVSTGSFWKTEMCRFGDQCKIKSTCRFAHDTSELRVKSHNGQEIGEEEKRKMNDQMEVQSKEEDDVYFLTQRNKSKAKSQTKKIKKATPNTIGLKLNKPTYLDDDEINTTSENVSVEEGNENTFYSDDNTKSSDGSDVERDRDLGSTSSMLSMRNSWATMNNVNTVWMPPISNTVIPVNLAQSLQISSSPAMDIGIGHVHLNGLPLGAAMPSSMPASMPTSPMMSMPISSVNLQQITPQQQLLDTSPVAVPSQTLETKMPWWQITEKDLVCAMPDHYED